MFTETQDEESTKNIKGNIKNLDSSDADVTSTSTAMAFPFSHLCEKIMSWTYGADYQGQQKGTTIVEHLEEEPDYYDERKDEVYVNIGAKPPPDQEKKPAEDIRIFCLNLSGLPRYVQFLLCCAAVFFFYLIYGYMQELIFQLPGFRPYGWYLTLVQFACYTMFGFLEMLIKRDRTRKIPLKMYIFLAFLTVATMGLSNTSVGYLNYPTQVIFKCCKLIPVMFGGVLIQGKRYTVIDVTAVMCMVVGLIMFTLADSSVSPNFNTYGVILIMLALCADGAIGNFQEKALKQYHGASNSEIVFYSYSIGFLMILTGLIFTGDLFPAFQFCKQHVKVTYGYAVIFSLTGYLGLYVVLTLVKSFGALIAVTVTTCRKAVTIVMSFLFFSKPFTQQYIWSGLIVVLGIYLNVYSKNRDKFSINFRMILSSWYSKIRQKQLGLAVPGTIV